MTILIAAILHAVQPAPVVHEGFAPHYAPGLMEKVARKRGMPTSGCLASSPLYPLGTVVHVHATRLDKHATCRIVDQSHPRDRARHIRTRRILELSWPDAKRLCGLRFVGQEPPEHCPVIIQEAK